MVINWNWTFFYTEIYVPLLKMRCRKYVDRIYDAEMRTRWKDEEIACAHTMEKSFVHSVCICVLSVYLFIMYEMRSMLLLLWLFAYLITHWHRFHIDRWHIKLNINIFIRCIRALSIFTNWIAAKYHIASFYVRLEIDFFFLFEKIAHTQRTDKSEERSSATSSS